MENEMKVIRLIQANLRKLPNQTARLRVLRYLAEAALEEEQQQEAQAPDPRQLSFED